MIDINNPPERQEIIRFHCDMCNEGIRASDGVFEGDEYYDFGDIIICHDCLDDFISQFRKRCD